MDASDRFFAKLRSLALTLEGETAQLQQTHKNPGDGGTQGALKVLCEVHTEVRDLKGKVQEELACWTAEEKETRAFIRACLVLKQRTTEDLRRIQRHYEKYGYRPLDSTTKPTGAKGPEKDPKAPVVEQDGDGGVQEQEVEEGQEADVAEQLASCKTPVAPPPPAPDTMRTPRLSDFGLSGFHPMASVGALSVGFCPTITIETPPLPDPPKMPRTPKCVLQMDEDVPTPRLEDFGISEYTTCFNNDFTMELLRKQPAEVWRGTAAPSDVGHDQKQANCPTVPAAAPPGHSQEALELHSVKLTDFCTPVSKVNQKQTPHSPPDDLHGSALQLSPELPVFETPYVSKLMSTVKSTKAASLDSAATDEAKTCPPSGDAVHEETWSCDLPSMAARPVLREESTPEMPVLETFLTSSVPPKGNEQVSSRVPMFVENETQLPDLQSHPEDWDLLSPPARSSHTLHLPDPDTPQMPDVSLFTQDIIKLLSQSNTRTPAMIPPSPKSTVPRSTTAARGKENRVQVLAPVSEDEFAALPGYLRQMPLSSMNQAIGKINRAVMDKDCGAMDAPRFTMEELKGITSTGVKAHLYLLCLTELRRLQQVQEEGSGLVFRVLSQTQGRDKDATLRTPC